MKEAKTAVLRALQLEAEAHARELQAEAVRELHQSTAWSAFAQEFTGNTKTPPTDPPPLLRNRKQRRAEKAARRRVRR